MLKFFVLVKLLLRSLTLLTWLMAGVLFVVMALGSLLPPGHQVAFMSDRKAPDRWDIYVLDLTRGVVIPLTDDPAPQRYPAWSPDGSQMAYHMDIDQGGPVGYDLYIMEADGSNQRPLEIAHAETFNDEAMLAWSPDGASVIFHMGIQYQTDFRLYIADTVSRDFYPITQGIGDAIQGDVSPDGTKLVFSAERYDTLSTGNNTTGYTRYSIYVLDLDSSVVNPNLNELRMRRLTDDSQVSYFPAWSPDGTKIAYTASIPGMGVEDIYVMDADGRNPVNLTQGRYLASTHPEWTPDGRIIFASNIHADFDLYIMEADGTNVRQLTEGEGNDQAPDWRPNSRG